MAVQNSLVQAGGINNKVVEYESGGKTVKLSPSIIKNYLVSGNGSVSDQEVVMFLNLCKYQGLNPFLREAYLIKYGSQPATIVTSKEAMTKRAMRNEKYAGQQAGVIVLKQDGTLEERIGTLTLRGEALVGGWAKVYMEGFKYPIETTVSFDEYCQKKDGKPMSNWATKPATMIRKVALVHALREAFPSELGGMYSAEENNVDEAVLPANTVPEPIPDPEPSAPDAKSALFGNSEPETLTVEII